MTKSQCPASRAGRLWEIRRHFGVRCTRTVAMTENHCGDPCAAATRVGTYRVRATSLVRDDDVNNFIITVTVDDVYL